MKKMKFVSLCRATLCTCLALLRRPSQASAMQLWRRGPMGLTKNGYTWQAGVDRPTGKAFSQEQSRLPSDRGQPLVETTGGGILGKTSAVLGRYPQWLCRGSVTLGLFRAVPAHDGGTWLQTRLFKINLLTFGKPVGRRIALKSNRIREEAVQWTYPILGGLLAAQPGGHLVVTLKSIATNVPTLDTQLVDYRPRLVGKHVPANAVRVCLYLGTQSFVHGYVMWRFHRHVRNSFYKSKQS